MRTIPLFVFAIGILFEHSGYALATSRVGPDSAHKHPTAEQSDWPRGIVALPRHESRVYSVWVNGSENFYFKADLKGINELIGNFSRARMRDHSVIIKQGRPKTTSFDKEEFPYNVNLYVLAGISLGYVRGKEIKEAKTHEPTLTIYLTEKEAADWLPKIIIPDNIILTSEFAGLKSPRQRPIRKNWFAEVQFDNGKPGVDFRNNVQTRVTLWDSTSQQGIYLGGVGHKGGFVAPFSEAEMDQLRSGDSWLTLTTGNWGTELKPDHPRLRPADLYSTSDQVKPVKIDRPGFRHGRILLQNGNPASLNPPPWPGAKIKVLFGYTGSIPVDEEGYFKVFLTDEQFTELKDKKPRRNIYIPYQDKKGRSSARFAFPATKLGPNKEKAGVVKIPHATVK